MRVATLAHAAQRRIEQNMAHHVACLAKTANNHASRCSGIATDLVASPIVVVAIGCPLGAGAKAQHLVALRIGGVDAAAAAAAAAQLIRVQVIVAGVVAAAVAAASAASMVVLSTVAGVSIGVGVGVGVRVRVVGVIVVGNVGIVVGCGGCCCGAAATAGSRVAVVGGS